MGVLGVLAALGCMDKGAGQSAADEATTVERDAIINGAVPSLSDANAVSFSISVDCVGQGSEALARGSGIFLTNNWILTAGHVVDGESDSDPTCKNNTRIANRIDISFGNQSRNISQIDAVLLHPTYKGPGHTDMALVHVTTPFQIAGSTSGYQRPISNLSLDAMMGVQTRCFGYGRRNRLVPGETGDLRSADFTIGRSDASPTLMWRVFKGGGSAFSDSGNGRILAPGDSGCGCVATSGPAGRQAVLGIHFGSDTRPICGGNADCPNNGTCLNSVCTTNDSTFSDQISATAFRDFANAALRSESLPIQVDIDQNGSPDVTMFIRVVNGQFVVDFVTPPNTSFPFLTGIPDLGIVAGAIQNFAGMNTGDFNNDGTTDILGLVGGLPLYFNSALGAINFTNPFSGTLGATQADGFAFSTIRDFNGDGFDDAQLFRADGSSKMFFGSSTGLGNGSPPPSYGPDFDGDGVEDIAFSAPGTTVPPVAGAVHLVFGNGGTDSWSGDSTAGADSANDDFFGNALAWGNFDGDETDELIVTSRSELRYIDQNVNDTRSIRQDEITDPPHTVAFGQSLAAGDFDGDGFDDLAIKAGNSSAQIVVLFGGPGGLSESSRSQTIDGAAIDPGIEAIVSMGAGDFNCDGRDDVAFGSFSLGRGVVGVFYGAQNGLSEGSHQLWDATAVGEGPPSQTGDGFGAFVVAGNFNGDEQGGRACHDLAIAATEQNGGGIDRAGVVYVLYSNGTILHESGADVLEPCCGQPFFPEGNSGFGMPMAISHLNTDRFDDLVVGWSNFQGSNVEDGTVFAFSGGASGISPSSRERWAKTSSSFSGFGEGIGGTSTGLVAVGTPFGAGGVLDVFEQNGLSRGPSRRFVQNDFIYDTAIIFGREITGPRPGRAPVRERPRASINDLSELTEALSFMSFEDPLRGWTSTAPLSFDGAQKTQGQSSLVVSASGNVVVDSAPFGTTEIERVGTKLALDVFVPQTQPNPSWLGDVQMSFTAAAANLNNAYIGYAGLTGLTRGQWNTVEFTVPSNIVSTLLGDFPRARFTITMNTPGGAQPLRLDNLRFRGTLTRRTVFHRKPAAPIAPNALFGFEALSDWTSPQAALDLTTLHVVQGSSALAIPAGGYREIRSRAFSTSGLSGVTPKLALSVYIPSNQPNPTWVGDVQAFFSCPSIGLNNVPVGQVILTNLFYGEYNRIKFNLPANVVSALTTSHSDAQFSFALNVGASSDRYFFDDLGFSSN